MQCPINLNCSFMFMQIYAKSELSIHTWTLLYIPQYVRAYRWPALISCETVDKVGTSMLLMLVKLLIRGQLCTFLAHNTPMSGSREQNIFLLLTHSIFFQYLLWCLCIFPLGYFWRSKGQPDEWASEVGFASFHSITRGVWSYFLFWGTLVEDSKPQMAKQRAGSLQCSNIWAFCNFKDHQPLTYRLFTLYPTLTMLI